MRGLYVDTGVWLALLDASDPLHERARLLIESHKTYRFISTDLVLSETITLLRRELGPDPAAAFGRDFLDGKIGLLVRCESFDWVDGLALVEKYRDLKVSLADATSITVVRRLDIEKVASFDKHFKIILAERQVLGPA